MAKSKAERRDPKLGAKPDAKKWPMLKKAWDEYGHSVEWDNLLGMKSDRGCYVALAWMDGDKVNYADLARARDEPWEMQNDGHDLISLDTWKKARVKAECDWLEFKLPNGTWSSCAPEWKD